MNFKRLFPILPFICLLGACQTTGMGGSAAANGSIPYGLTPADSNMTCAQMQAEFNRMDQIIAAGQQSQQGDVMTQAGAQVAQQAAYSTGYNEYSGLFGSLSNIGRQMSNANQQQVQQQARAAQKRRDDLLDLAYRKGCIQ